MEKLCLCLGLLLLCSSIIAEDRNHEEIPVIEGFGTINIKEESDVLLLEKDNFDYVVSTNALLLVEFYAPWCGHCKSLEPEYVAAAKELKTQGIRIAKVDVTLEDSLGKRFEITGFPTIKLFMKGHKDPVDEFDGSRTKQGIVDYMRKKADPNYEPPASVVEDLDGESFPEFVEQYPLSLVEFYAPWCGHCKTLAPEYEGAALDLKAWKIPLAKVDAIDQKDLATEYEVTSFPTLFIFRHGQKYAYKGPRDRTGIVAYMKQHSQPPSKKVSSKKQLKSHVRPLDSWVLATFTDENHELFKQYISAAHELREEMVLMHTEDSSLIKSLGVTTDSIHVVLQEDFRSKYEPAKQSLSKVDSQSSDIVEWIRDSRAPLVGLRRKDNLLTDYIKRPLLVVYFDVSWTIGDGLKEAQFFRGKILPVAHRHKEIQFAISDETDFASELVSLNLQDSGEYVNAAIFDADGLRYIMEPDQFSEDLLEEFVGDYKKGVLKPVRKSQPIPRRQDGPVKSVVANSFDDVIMGHKHDVIIEFYAPWCGHCKSLEPVYKKVAQACLQSHPNLLIAKMDATANDLSSLYQVKGYPSIYFLSKDDKLAPLKFEGERTYEGLMKFINEHSSDSQSSQKEEL